MWYEIIIAIAGGSLGAIATLVAGVYRKTQDRKETWWERFTWASSALQSSDEGTRGAAREILLALSMDERATLADRKAAKALLAEQPVKILIATGSQTLV